MRRLPYRRLHSLVGAEGSSSTSETEFCWGDLLQPEPVLLIYEDVGMRKDPVQVFRFKRVANGN